MACTHWHAFLSTGPTWDPSPHIPENPTPPPGIILAPFLHLSLAALRLLALLPLYFTFAHPVRTYVSAATLQEPHASNGDGAVASSSLLTPTASHTRYGTFLPPPSTAGSVHSVTPVPTEAGIHVKPNPRRPTPEDQSLRVGFRKIRRLFPQLWPRHDAKLQLLAVLCMFILLIGRVVNFLSPLTLKLLVSKFDTDSTSTGDTWTLLFAYVFLKFLQGSGGLNAIRDVCSILLAHGLSLTFLS